ncbi:MAG: glycosyltransferase family 4 protein [Anaerolineae bacterium]|nr:glycosyltransferase family 4 protein [Anaerolineae bacterium]
MHILLIHQAFAALNQAGGTRHHELARYLAGQGHCVSIVASPVSYLTGDDGDNGAALEDNPRIQIYRSYTYNKLHKSFFHRLLSFFSFMVSSFITAIRIRAVDVVWGTSPPLFQAPSAWLVAKLKRKPFLLEIRDLWPLFAVEVGVLKNPFLIRLSEMLEKFLYRQADCVVVNSPGYIDHVRSHGGRRVELVPNGADPDLFAAEPDQAQAFRKEHGLVGKFVVLYAGAHGISNDLTVLLDAADLLRSNPMIHFLLVGDGKEKGNLMARAETLALPNVTFLPPVAKTKMDTILQAADLCAAILKPINVYKTTYPNKVFDAMAAGKAVLCVIDGVIRTVVEEAEAGVYTPPGDARQMAAVITALAAEPEQVSVMGRNGRQAVETRFHRKDQAARIETIFASLGLTPDGE